jgi:RAD51-like protein 2|tara:strand:- start:1378 stop:2355 length:978 start_codon:yes stop_codon:yes gene_type:complete
VGTLSSDAIDRRRRRRPVVVHAEAGLTNEEASEVMKVVRFGVDGTALAGAKSASELLREETGKLPIYTFSSELDALLGGGVAAGEITELCGCPGIGKTQMCVQLCASVQIPHAFGGYDGEAVYVDTEGSFMAERAEEIAEATARHLRSVSNASPEDAGMSDAIASFTAERMLERVHLFRCHEVTELLAVLEALPAYVKKHRVRLVVVDSVAFHFRQDFRDMALRTTILAKMTQRLQQLASENALAVVTVNQVTVKPDPRGGGARLVPALGESYAHACTTRIILSWEDDTRTAYLYKSPRLPQGRARYTVTEGGIRDVRGTKRPAE